MNIEQTRGKKPKLSLISAFSYFLKGNMIFALNGLVLYAIDSIALIFPSLFQQVFTDNIITRKSPEWFTPLMTLYVLLFLIELAVWIAFSILRRKSQARISISTSSNYLWTVLRLPMTLFSQFSPGELVARYTTIPKTIKLMDFTLPTVSALFFPALCCYFVILFNWKLGLLALFSILLLVIVMRSTTSVQKKIAMDLEVTEARLQNVTMTGIGTGHECPRRHHHKLCIYQRLARFGTGADQRCHIMLGHVAYPARRYDAGYALGCPRTNQ